MSRDLSSKRLVFARRLGALFALPAILLLSVSAREANVLEQIQALSPHQPAVARKIEDWKVSEWVLGPKRQRQLQPLSAARIVQVDQAYYVEEAKTGRWLVGNLPKRGSRTILCDAKFDNLQALREAAAFPALPAPPEGCRLREVGCLPYRPSRLASDGNGRVLYVLCVNGDVWRVEPAGNKFQQILWADRYLPVDRGEIFALGMALDAKQRLYLVVNQRIDSAKPIANQVTIYRTALTNEGAPAAPEPWLQTTYPWGIGPFNHGVGHIAFGPDGYLYVTSGSRTDGNEDGGDPRYAKGGETPLTACIWRLDPKADQPKIEVYARGLRNAYGYCWNDKGQMFATDNGPDADAPEELNQIERDGHYGFPYQFSNWSKKPYAHTPDPPAGLKLTLPIANLGPDAGGDPKHPLFTFPPHSSPSGIVFLGNDFPPAYRGGFLVAQFGNFIPLKQDVGFDVLHVRLSKGRAGRHQARVKRLLHPIARPVDLHLSGKGKVYICEHSRQIANKGYGGMLPGRILELSVE